MGKMYYTNVDADDGRRCLGKARVTLESSEQGGVYVHYPYLKQTAGDLYGAAGFICIGRRCSHRDVPGRR